LTGVCLACCSPVHPQAAKRQAPAPLSEEQVQMARLRRENERLRRNAERLAADKARAERAAAEAAEQAKTMTPVAMPLGAGVVQVWQAASRAAHGAGLGCQPTPRMARPGSTPVCACSRLSSAAAQRSMPGSRAEAGVAVAVVQAPPPPHWDPFLDGDNGIKLVNLPLPGETWGCTRDPTRGLTWSLVMLARP